MIDLHGYATRENCFGESEYAGDYDPDYVDDPTREVGTLTMAITEPSPANIAWRKRLEGCDE